MSQHHVPRPTGGIDVRRRLVPAIVERQRRPSDQKDADRDTGPGEPFDEIFEVLADLVRSKTVTPADGLGCRQ